MAINFFFPETKINLTNRKELKLFISKLIEKEGFKLDSLSYIFCSDNALLKINQDFLNHDYYTDIITFDLSTTKKAIRGEIYISTDRVMENATTFKTTFKEELHRVIFHGALHLCNYRDKKKTEAAKMRGAENKYLNLYFS